MDKRRDIVGISTYRDKQNQLIAYELFEALCRMKKILDNPRNNVAEYKATNEYYRDVTTVQGACRLLGVSDPFMAEDSLDTMINTFIGGHVTNMIPTEEVILPGRIDPKRIK